MKVTCPVCLAQTDLEEGPHCTTCGSLLDREMVQARAAEPTVETKADAAAPADAATTTSEDALVAAFRAQFEENRLTVPPGWTARLRALAQTVEAGRRYATVIFVDLRGYTRLSQILPELELKELRRWFSDVCTRNVERHGGFVLLMLGDAVFAGFGAPWGFERDAEAALRCLLDIRDEVRAMAKWKGGEDVAVRAGAASGVMHVVLAEEGGRTRPDLIGSPVNLAARLESHADTWEILIPEEYAELVGGVFVLEARAAFEPKNYGKEVTPFAVVGLRAEDEITRRRDDLAYIGRDAEIERVRGWMQRAAAGEFVCARVRAHAGMGKSRLVRHVADNVRPEGVTVHTAAIDPHERHVLLAPILALLRKMRPFESPVPGLDAAVIPALGYLLGIEPHRSALRALPPATLRANIQTGLLAYFAQAAANSPLALVIDDVQWCDPLSMEILRALVARAPQGLLLLVLERESGPGEGVWEELETQVDFATELLELAPLSPAESARLLDQIVEATALHPLLRERLLRETEGIPLYLIESVENARATSERVESQQLARELVEGTPLEKQRRLVDVLQARLDRLTAARRLVMQCGAVLGRRFSLRMLSAYEGVRDRLIDELAALKGLRLLRDEPTPEDIEFSFTPTMLRDAAYQMLTEEQRRLLHARFAELIETQFRERVEELAAELTSHWIRARRMDRARPYVREACLQAIRLGVPQEAYDLAARAISISEEDFEALRRGGGVPSALALQQVGVLHEQAGRAAWALGDYPGSLRHYEAWRAIAEQTNNGFWRAASAMLRAQTLFEQGENEKADAMLDEVRAADGVPPAVRTKAQNVRAGLLYRRGKYAEALEIYRQITSDGKGVAELVVADSWSTAGACLMQMGRLDEAESWMRTAHAIYAKHKAPLGEALALTNIGIVHERLGRFAAASESYAAGKSLAERHGYLHVLSAVAANRSNVAHLLGDYATTESEAADALRYARLIGHKNSEAIALINLALGHAGSNKSADARARIAEAADLARRQNDSGTLATALVESAWVELLAGDLDASERHLRQLVEGASSEDAASAKLIDQAIAAARARQVPQLTAGLPAGVERSVSIRAERLQDWLRQRSS